MSFLGGRLTRLPCHSELWMVKASMVTVRCLVWIWEKHFPPELYLKSEVAAMISVIWSKARNGVSVLKISSTTLNLGSFLLTWRICQTFCRWPALALYHTICKPLLFQDWRNRWLGIGTQHLGTGWGNAWTLIELSPPRHDVWLSGSPCQGRHSIQLH